MLSIQKITNSLQKFVLPLTALLAATMFICGGYAALGSVFALKLTQLDTPTQISGIILSMYYLGCVVASFTASKIVNKVGHIRAFGVFASLLSVFVLIHSFSTNLYYWAMLRFLEGYCVGGTSLCLESWLNSKATNANRGLVVSFYMVTSYLGAALGQLLISVPDPSGMLMYIIISIIFSLAMIPISLTQLSAPTIETHANMPIKRAYEVSPVGFVCCIASGVLVGTFYMLGTIYATSLGLNLKEVSLFMFWGVMGGMAAQIPFGRLSDKMDRRYVLVGISIMLIIVAPLANFLVTQGGTALIISTILIGAGTFTLYPISVSHVNDLVSEEERVSASGMLILAQHVGLVLGPILISAGMQVFGNWFFLAAFALIPALFVVFTIQHIKKKPDINYLNVTPTQPIPTVPTSEFNNLTSDDDK